MAHPRHVHVFGGIYLVSAIGDHGQTIFVDDSDRAGLGELLAQVIKRCDAQVHAFKWLPDELVMIVNRIARNDDYLLAPGVGDALLEWFGQIERDRNFGNAREARKLLEGMRKAQSGRLRALGRMPSRDDLRTLVLEDLLVATS